MISNKKNNNLYFVINFLKKKIITNKGYDETNRKNDKLE